MGEARDRSTAELLDRLRSHLEPSGPITIFGGVIPLVDALIHHQDIRRPLGHPREVPPERLRVVLDLALKAPPVGAGKRAAGLRVEASDLDWSHGEGPRCEAPPKRS
ncbi:maleylpyruvate isomerase family mycothiol-dependent enzyme [Saccharopolyspora rhizosphaerae]|uniref:maleylpyruvate isomerase family mycothiol-dependent enzyme n=1 Tax=Saccharopolyspora rhizosphaerae TaxID=2492662 RepID=UPI001F2B2B4C|nr:maleylpyruvate isomerase family mycothiol-dependent enzyme [Saccharopolyspora rhizosphaerae]